MLWVLIRRALARPFFKFYNICFCEEIRKILLYYGCKKYLIWSYAHYRTHKIKYETKKQIFIKLTVYEKFWRTYCHFIILWICIKFMRAVTFLIYHMHNKNLLDPWNPSTFTNGNFWLCRGLRKHQPLWVILCRLPEKGTRDRRANESEEIKTLPLNPYLLQG